MTRAWTLAIVFSAGLSAATISPDDVKVLGDLDYGQTSDPVEYSSTPRYRAFVFPGNSGDNIEVTVKSADRKAYVAIADGALKELASGTTHLTFKLPDVGPDAQAWYILFRDSEEKPATFTVELKRTGKSNASLKRPGSERNDIVNAHGFLHHERLSIARANLVAVKPRNGGQAFADLAFFGK
jgi:hypothetical protein